MHIGYDAKRAFLNNTGLGNYSRWLIKAMALNYPDHQYGLYTPEIRDNRHLAFLKKIPHTQTITPKGKFLSSLWRTKSIIKNLKADGVELYHGLSHELPLGIKPSGIKSVLTVHDLIAMRFPQYFGFINWAIYRAKLLYACKAADQIIAISQKTRADLIDLLKVDGAKIAVIYQGCDPAFKLHQSDAQRKLVRKKYDLPKRYLLTVGTIEERKKSIVTR